jgi:hypothetical protein
MSFVDTYVLNRQDGPRFTLTLPGVLRTDNWVMVEGTAVDLYWLLQYHGWAAFEALGVALEAQEQRLDYHVEEIRDDHSFYSDAKGDPNWIVAALNAQIEQVRQSWRVWFRWSYFYQNKALTLRAVPVRKPRVSRPARIKVQTLAEAIPAYNASKEEVARWRKEQVTPLGPEAPLVRA